MRILRLTLHIICTIIVMLGGADMDTNMPFSVTIQEPANTIPQEKMLADTDALLSEFAADYQRMAE